MLKPKAQKAIFINTVVTYVVTRDSGLSSGSDRLVRKNGCGKKTHEETGLETPECPE